MKSTTEAYTRLNEPWLAANHDGQNKLDEYISEGFKIRGKKTPARCREW